MCVHRDTGAQRAVKVLRKSHMDDDEKKMLFNEINILRELVSAFSLPTIFIKLSLCDYDSYLYIKKTESNFYFRITPTSSKCTSSSRMRSATTLSLSKSHIQLKF